jgi:hypothetical protein
VDPSYSLVNTMATPRALSRRRLLLGGIGALLAGPALARATLTGRTRLRRFAIAPFVVPRVRSATRFGLVVKPIRERMMAVAVSPRSTLVLRLGGVRVARPPKVVWRAYLTPPGLAAGSRGPYFVGNVALFGAGVGPNAPPAAFEFRADTAVARALRTARDALELTFVPSGPLVNGKPTSPRPAAALRVATLELWVETL